MTRKNSSLRQGSEAGPSPWAGDGARGRLVRAIGEQALVGACNDPVALPERTADQAHTECAAIELALRREVGRRVTLASGRVLEQRRGKFGVGEVFALDGKALSPAEFDEYARKCAR